MATKILIAINVLVMAVLAIKYPALLLAPDTQSLIDSGANFGLFSCSGQEWRLFTYMFLHVGVLHLAVNMWALWKVGPPAEDLFGWREMLAIYVFSGIMGSLASCLYNPTQVSAGASAAIFGVYGSLLSFMYVQRERYSQKTLHQYAWTAAIFLGCNVLYGCMMPDIDNSAHMGGLLSGGFSGFLFAQLQVKERYRNAYTFPVLMLLVGATCAVTHVAFDRRGYNFYVEGLHALKNNDFEAAVQDFSLFISQHPADSAAYGSRGFAYMKLNMLNQSAADFMRVIVLAPHCADSYNSLAWDECGMKDYDRAVEHASEAIKLDPKFAQAYDTRGYALSRLGRTKEAQADFAKAISLTPKDPAAHYHLQKILSPEEISQTDANRQRALIAKRYNKEVWED